MIKTLHSQCMGPKSDPQWATKIPNAAQHNQNTDTQHVTTKIGLPWWLSHGESSCQCRRLRFNPWPRNIPTCHRATGPVHHDYWDCVLESRSHNRRSLSTLEPVLQNRRGPRSEKPHPATREWPPLATTRQSPPPVGGPRTAKIINK